MLDKLGKRGLVEVTFEWALAMGVTVVVMLVMFIVVASFQQQHPETSSIDAYVYMSKQYYSPHQLNYINPKTEQILTGHIDLYKFSSDNLAMNNEYFGEYVAAKLTLLDESGNAISNAGLPRRENPIYDNPDLYNQLEPFALVGVRGAGGATYRERTFPVVLVTNESQTKAYLRVLVVIPNS